MNSRRWYLLALSLVTLAAGGCATTGGPQYYSPSNVPDQLQKMQSQIYDAATGPYRVGGTGGR